MSLSSLVGDEGAPSSAKGMEPLGSSPEGEQETDDLDLHLKTLFSSGASPERKKAAFKAAVHACMDEYGPPEAAEGGELT